VIEEAPAPGMTPEVRAAMGTAATRAAEAIGYAGAGTVEFIVDGSGPLRTDGFWFMEMNTRLQVEHPVTEAVTGVDLVEWQLRVAAGEPLPMAQDQIPLNGHAVEARLYAEDPANGFLPATGRLSHLRFPQGVRADSGVRAGDQISPFYDPMIAKLITHAPDRTQAIAALRQGLAETVIAGTVTNLGFLWRLLGEGAFAEGRMDTGLIDRAGAALSDDPAPGVEAWALATLAAMGLPREGADGWHIWVPLVQTVRLRCGAVEADLRVSQTVPGSFEVSVGEEAVTLSAVTTSGHDWQAECDGRRLRAALCRDGDTVTLLRGGATYRFERPDPLLRGSEAEVPSDRIVAPMPGLVRRLSVAPGQEVTAGEVLLVLEAMKMEHSLRAPRDGTVGAVRVAEGSQVAQGDMLVALEDADA
ncbi:MAG: biotin/lipoyl-containing protein, partial [Pseudomonadota bacterium]